MTSIYAPRKTLAPNNQFVLTCPVFNVEAPIATCFRLRDLVWKGQKPDVRKGCQCAMAADKCPINHILKDMMRSDEDPYHSPERRVGSLKDKHLERIAPILIGENTIDRYGCSEGERKLLVAANEQARAGVVAKPKRSKPAEKAQVAAEVKKAPPAPAKETELEIQTGDMSAVVNKMMEESR